VKREAEEDWGRSVAGVDERLVRRGDPQPALCGPQLLQIEKWTKDGTKIDHAMKSLAQVGLMALYIFSTSSQQSLRFSASEPKWIN